MSGWRKLYYKLLNLPLSILVKSKVIPTDPISEHGIDPTRPVMYVLPYDSKADLLTLRAQCLKHDLPDPLAPLEIDGTPAAAPRIYSRWATRLPLFRGEPGVGQAVP